MTKETAKAYRLLCEAVEQGKIIQVKGETGNWLDMVTEGPRASREFGFHPDRYRIKPDVAVPRRWWLVQDEASRSLGNKPKAWDTKPEFMPDFKNKYEIIEVIEVLPCTPDEGCEIPQARCCP